MFGIPVGANTRLRPREDVENPRSARCKTALRRICGVCRHFEGDMRGKGTCVLLGLTGHEGRKSAFECEYWGRRWK